MPPVFQGRTKEEQDYFLALAHTHEHELQLHETLGKLWEKDESGRDWSNVTEHCLIEAARAETLAELLGLSHEIREVLGRAAAVHDFNKREEIKRTKSEIAEGGSGRQAVLAIEKENEAMLRNAGVSEMVISFAGHVTGDPEDTFFVKEILDKHELTEEDCAHLIAHYIDNYTRGSSWAEPAEIIDGKKINDIDRRNIANAANPDYSTMNEEGITLNAGHPFFDGMTRFEAAAAINHEIEKRFASMLQALGVLVEPEDLPEYIDRSIREKIKTARR